MRLFPATLLLCALLEPTPVLAQATGAATPDPAAPAAAGNAQEGEAQTGEGETPEGEAAAAETADTAAPLALPATRAPLPPASAAWERLAAGAEDWEVTWLEAAGQRFLGLYRPDMSGTAKGALLLVHASGQHPDWPNTLEVIRRQLPRHGWATLAVSLPDPVAPGPPPRPEPPPAAEPTAADAEADPAAENPTADNQAADNQTAEAEPADNATETDPDGEASPTPARRPQIPYPEPDTVAPDTRETEAQQYLQAAFAELQANNQFNIAVLGSGDGALRAAQFLQSLPGPTPQQQAEGVVDPMRALILVDANNQVSGIEPSLPAVLTEIAVPVLDIVTRRDPASQRHAQQRRDAAARGRLANYRFRQLPAPGARLLKGNQLGRSVWGFLATHAAGDETEAQMGEADAAPAPPNF